MCEKASLVSLKDRYVVFGRWTVCLRRLSILYREKMLRRSDTCAVLCAVLRQAQDRAHQLHEKRVKFLYDISQMFDFCFIARVTMQTSELTTKLYSENVIRALFVIILTV